ncbi:hypothetical protein Q6348_04950 [Isoptericola sp. b441]|uniref:Uncharacterized protein n=1 Tax=Actinotalea lenta TaxID=3064654 RepID=A0ABT9DC87_9CELL|nr:MULTISPECIES: hypothetical protein [unclassified Isoptericola]MDO8106542.1 hypothetical protein [Isoptericola sp. b441]MDO8121750.1 hypothetical protein [Isoptericola sp. b490]
MDDSDENQGRAVPSPPSPGAWLPVAPPPVRRPTPWWVALVAVLSGLLLLGVGATIGFGLGYLTGSQHARHEVEEHVFHERDTGEPDRAPSDHAGGG